MPDWRLRQVVHHLQHPQSSHPDTHRGAAVLLLWAQLWAVIRQCHQLQESHEDTHRWADILWHHTQNEIPVSLRLMSGFLLLQEKNHMCAQCLAVRSASQNTPAFTNTMWSTHPANLTTVTTVGKPTSRSQRSPCTNAQPTTTRSPSRRSRRPTLNPQQVGDLSR